VAIHLRLADRVDGVWMAARHGWTGVGSRIDARSWLAPLDEAGLRLASLAVARAADACRTGRVADAERWTGQVEAAVAAGVLEPRERAVCLAGLLSLYERAGRHDAAVRAFAAMVASSDPNDALRQDELESIAMRLADAARRQGRHAQAVTLLQPWQSRLSNDARAALAQSRRAAAAEYDRLVGTGNLALTHKAKDWAQARLVKATVRWEPRG
jgi:hypothetical protein